MQLWGMVGSFQGQLSWKPFQRQITVLSHVRQIFQDWRDFPSTSIAKLQWSWIVYAFKEPTKELTRNLLFWSLCRWHPTPTWKHQSPLPCPPSLEEHFFHSSCWGEESTTPGPLLHWDPELLGYQMKSVIWVIGRSTWLTLQLSTIWVSFAWGRRSFMFVSPLWILSSWTSDLGTIETCPDSLTIVWVTKVFNCSLSLSWVIRIKSSRYVTQLRPGCLRWSKELCEHFW